MIISLWDEIVNKRADKSEDEIFEWLSRHGISIFEPLREGFKVNAKIILFYILHAYSPDSQLIIKSADWLRNKKAIADLVNLPDHLYADVTKLKSECIRQVVSDYLDLHTEREFKHLQNNKELYEKLNDIFFQSVMEKEAPDFKEINERRKWRDELLESIQKMEEKLREDYAYAYFNKEELAKAALVKSQSDSLAVENSKFIKKS